MVYVLCILILYISFILHEIGHCIIPMLFGIRNTCTINLGMGKPFICFNIKNINIRINKLFLPFGYVERNRSYKNMTFIELFTGSMGGVLSNLLIAFISFSMLYFKGIYSFAPEAYSLTYIKYTIFSIVNSSFSLLTKTKDTLQVLQSLLNNNALWGIILIIATINSFIFVFNTIPFPAISARHGNLTLNDGGNFLISIIKVKQDVKKQESSESSMSSQE